MKKLIGILLMVTWITTSAFSQTTYPKKILLDTDTVVAITPQQLIEINLSRNDYMQLKELHTQLQKYVVASDSTIYYWERVAATKDTEIQLERQKFEEAEKINKSITEAFESQKKKSKRTVIGVGVGGTLVGILLGVLLK